MECGRGGKGRVGRARDRNGGRRLEGGGWEGGVGM